MIYDGYELEIKPVVLFSRRELDILYRLTRRHPLKERRALAYHKKSVPKDWSIGWIYRARLLAKHMNPSYYHHALKFIITRELLGQFASVLGHGITKLPKDIPLEEACELRDQLEHSTRMADLSAHRYSYVERTDRQQLPESGLKPDLLVLDGGDQKSG